MELQQILIQLPQLIAVIKFFGTLIVGLLSIIAVLGGIIWRNLRQEISSNKREAAEALKTYKEDEIRKCAGCSQANVREHEEIWEAIEVCCPRGK